MSEEPEFFNPWKQFTGCWLPNWLLERDELDLGPKVCYARLAQFAGRNGIAVVKQDVLARKLGSDDRSVSRWLSKLRTAGLVHVTRRGPYKPAEYRFLHHHWMLGAVPLPDAPDRRIKTRQIGSQDTPDLPVTPNTEKKPKRGAASEPPRSDVEELCQLLADRIIANGGTGARYRNKPASKAWQDPMRRLIDLDGISADRVRKAIDWCQADEFWKAVILSPANLRENYDKLRLAAQRPTNGNGNGYRNGRPPTPVEEEPPDLGTRIPLHDMAAFNRWADETLATYVPPGGSP